MTAGTVSPVFLIGFMASGKSTVGRLVARRLGWQFVDLDEVIAGAAAVPVAEIFRHEGEEGFRRREADAVRAACALAEVVVATGGGAACREDNLEAMLHAGRVVALSATPAEILERARSSGAARPLLDQAADPELTARSLLARREPFYARAHHRVDTVGKSAEAVADEVVRALNRRP